MAAAMDELARSLNERLEGCVVGNALSDLGRRMYFPKGVVAQTAEAAEHAHRFDVTVGIAATDGEPMYLPSVGGLVAELSPHEAFAYAPTAGLPPLRRAWQDAMLVKNPSLRARVSLPLVTSGLTHAILLVSDLFIGEGDVVLVPDLFWGNYRLIFVERSRAQLGTFPLFPLHQSQPRGMDLPGLDHQLGAVESGRKAAIILNFPNNPSGHSPRKQEAGELVACLKRHAERGVIVVAVCDDAYTGLFYESDVFPESVFAPLADLHENLLAIKIDGATKENYAWGFRVGFITFAGLGLQADHFAALESKVMGAVRSSISNSSRLAQSIMLKAMQSTDFEEERRVNFALMADRYAAVREVVDGRGEAGLQPLPFNSGYFLTLRVDGGKAEALRSRLLHERGIGTISVGDDHLRVAYSAIRPSDIPALFDEIFSAASDLSGQ